MSAYRPLHSIDLIAIHCAATANGRRVTPEAIDGWHATRGFARNAELVAAHGHQAHLKAIGYHFVIGHNGVVDACRALTETGAHAVDDRWPSGDRRRRTYNERGIAICLVGTDSFSLPQWQALDVLVRGLLRDLGECRGQPPANRYLDYGRPDADAVRPLCDRLGVRIIGHRDLGGVSPRECPGFSVADWITGGLAPLPGHIFAGRLDA